MFVEEGWISPGSLLWRLIEVEQERDPKDIEHEDVAEAVMADASTALSTFLRTLKTAKVIMPDGRSVLVDDVFLSAVNDVAPFRHEFFDLPSGIVGGQKRPYFIAMRDVWRSLARRGDYRRISFRSICAALMVAWVVVFAALIILRPESRDFYYKAIMLCLAWDAFVIVVVPETLSRLFRREACKACRGYEGGRLLLRQSDADRFVMAYYETMPAVVMRKGEAQEVLSEDSASDEERCALNIVRAHDQEALKGAKLKKEVARELFGETVSSGRAFIRAWEMARRMRPELGGSGRPPKPAHH